MRKIYVYVTDTDNGVDINHYTSRDSYLEQVKHDLQEAWDVIDLDTGEDVPMPDDIEDAYVVYVEHRNNCDTKHNYFWYEYIIDLS